MELYYAPASPFARKAHACIIELGLLDQVDLIVTPVIPGKPNQEYVQQSNPLGKIPSLKISDADTLFDSTTICLYLDSISTTGSVLPENGPERHRTLTRHALAHGICESAVTIRYETFLRPEDKQWDVWIDDQWNKIDRALAWFDSHQSDWQGPVDLAQITLGCALGYLDFRSPDHQWRTRHSELAQWFDKISDRESFSHTLPTA